MKLVKAFLVLFSLIQILLAKRQFVRPDCNTILLQDDCIVQPHCKWNFTFDNCETAVRAVLVRRPAVLVRPYARYGGYLSRGYVSRPSVSFARPTTYSVSRPTYSVSRPAMTVSRPTVSVSRPVVGRHRRFRRF